MYTDLNYDDIRAASEKYIHENDRSLYYIFYETVEKYISDKPIYVGDKVASMLLCNMKLNCDTTVWNLYADDVYDTAIKITNIVFQAKSKHISTKTTTMLTNIPNKEYTIYVNARMLFKLYSIQKYRGESLAKVFGNVQVSGFFGNKIYSVGEDVILIELYRILYSPSRQSDWLDCLDMEKKIFNRIQQKDISKIGQGETKKNITDDIYRLLSSMDSTVVVGEYALKHFKIINQANRLQIITDVDPEHIKNIIKHELGQEIVVVNHNIRLQFDFQITKNSVYVKHNDNQTLLVEIYNSTTYELVPYITHNNIKFGSYWVILKWIFVDIWILKMINAKHTEIAGINKLLNNATKLRQILYEKYKEDPFSVFQLTNYQGTYISDIVAKKKLINESNVRIRPYYPHIELRS